MRKTVKTAAIGAAVAVAIGGLAGAAGAVPTPHKPALKTKAVATEGVDALQAAAAAYLKVYPSMSQADAEAAAKGQDVRKELVVALQTGDGANTFGGAWFDPPTGTLHLNATTDAALSDAASSAARLGVNVATHKVARSYAQLEAKADSLRAGKSAVAEAAAGAVGIDVQSNAVVAAVPKARIAQLSASKAASVKLVAAKAQSVEADAGCTTRAACDWTIRAGAIMWRGTTTAKTPWCSVGFTGRDAANQRWVITAGHCSTGNGVNWGTGDQNIGPMSSSRDSGAVDAALIRVTNSWFTGDTGGEIYLNSYVNGVAPSVGYMVAGETVCLAANFTQPSYSGNKCGVLGTNSDASVRGMARVDGLDACGGDSGGGWYWLTSTGRRIAYGIHSRSDSGCHGDAGGTRSWFGPIATVKSSFAPNVNVEYRP